MIFRNKWMCVHVIVILIFISHCDGNSFINYLWPGSSQESTLPGNTDLDIKIVPFELGEKDEKFLQQAAQLIGLKLSDLDMCHHRVVLRLKEACHKLNSEDLGKLAVMLLNCQSAAEGRTIFPCNENMSLKDCTSPMDADTWNTYHLVTNRAKAVCYRVRQEQFQGLTEMTVNKLMNTAHSQLAMMSQISANQDRLDERTLETLQSVQDKNDELLRQQDALSKTHEATRHSVESNIRELFREKALIKSGQLQVMELTKSVQKKLDDASLQLDNQLEERRINHDEILNDLKELHQQAQDVWLKIEDSTNFLADQNLMIAQQYDRTLDKLKEINNTINFLSGMLDKTKHEIDDKLGWLVEVIGGTGYTLDLLYLILSHFFFLLMLMILSAFLNMDLVSRFLIVTVVGANLILALNKEYLHQDYIAALDLQNLSIALVVILTVKSLIIEVLNRKNFMPKLQISDGPPKMLRSQSDLNIVNRDNNSHSRSVSRNSFDESVIEHIQDLPQIPENVNRSRLFDISEAYETSVEYTPPVSRNGYAPSELRLRSENRSTPDLNKQKCSALTRKGENCRSNALIGRYFCRRHLMGSSFIGH